MNNLKRVAIALGGILLAAGPAAAFGDMGTAPTTQGMYASGEGGYMLLDDQDISAYGVGGSNVFVSPEDGWFAGGMIGHAGSPMLFGFTRIEGYYLYNEADDDVSHGATPGLAMTSVDGATITVGGSGANASAERTTSEGGLRFEQDKMLNSTTYVTWVVSPFLRFTEAESNATITGGCCIPHRTSDVDTWLYGVLIAAEPEKWVAPRVALVGRLGAGIYGYDADGDFRSFSNLKPDIFFASVSDSESGVGFRGQLGAGLKFRIGQASFLETFAEADYFSDIGVAKLPTNTNVTFRPAGVDTDDLWEFRTGARLTVPFGGGAQ